MRRTDDNLGLGNERSIEQSPQETPVVSTMNKCLNKRPINELKGLGYYAILVKV